MDVLKYILIGIGVIAIILSGIFLIIGVKVVSVVLYYIIVAIAIIAIISFAIYFFTKKPNSNEG